MIVTRRGKAAQKAATSVITNAHAALPVVGSPAYNDQALDATSCVQISTNKYKGKFLGKLKFRLVRDKVVI